MPTLTISAVIPTRNRPESLRRLLQALSRQERLPDEVIVVDASDGPRGEEVLQASIRPFPTRYLRTSPSVCAQRNIGIRCATGSHVLLCDDDIEPPPDYLRTLASYLDDHESTGAVSGLICEPGAAGQVSSGLREPSLRSLLFRFMFQLTVSGDVEATRSTWLTAPVVALLKVWYRYRGNTFSLAGWPLLTQTRGRSVCSVTYGLGAALVRRDWLLHSPYDERLGPHGIGDNYGVALGFPDRAGIAVLTTLPVLHHRAPDNRLDAATTYYQRALALHYFLRTSGGFSTLASAFLAWSLAGNAGLFLMRGQRDLLKATFQAIAAITLGRNPLLTNLERLAETGPANGSRS